MKRIISFVLVLTMVLALLPPLPVRAASPAPENQEFFGDSGFGKMLNNGLQTQTGLSASGQALPSLIQTLSVQGTTATVTLTAPRDALLVVGVYDETEDVLLGSGTLAVTAGEEARQVTIDIEIDQMPRYYRGKAFLLDPVTYAPISTHCQYEQATQGYQSIADAKFTDFPAEQALNLDEDINTNFVVFREDVIRLTPDQVTDNGDGTYTLTNAPALQPGDVFCVVYPDKDMLPVKVASVSEDGRTVREDSNAAPEDFFDMIKLDIDSSDYGFVASPEAQATPTASSGSAQVHLLANDPLHTFEWEAEEDEIKCTLLDDLPSITIPLKVTVQYYFGQRSVVYSYFSGVVDYSIDLSIDLAGKDLSLAEKNPSWKPRLDIPTPIPSITVQLVAVLDLKLEAGASYHIKLDGSFGKELYLGAADFHDIGRAPALGHGLEAKGGIEFSFAAGLGVAFLKRAVNFSILGKVGIELEVGAEWDSDISEKLHVCDLCLGMEITGGVYVTAMLEITPFLEWSGDLPIHKKKLGEAHWCPAHDRLTYPYDEGKETSHHGLEACQRNAWKVTLNAVDNSGNPLRVTQVSLERRDHRINPKIYAPATVDLSWKYLTQEDLVTDSSGKLEIYLENGDYQFSIGDSHVAFSVADAPTLVTLNGTEDTPEAGEITLVINVPSRLALDSSAPMTAVLHTPTSDIDVTNDVTWGKDDLLVLSIDEDTNTVTAKQQGTSKVHARFTFQETIYTAEVDVLVYEIIAGGTQGSMIWEYGSDYVLKISGEGRMPGNPWRAYNPRIERIIIEEGITSISASAFEECVVLKQVTLPVSLQEIGSRAFALCESLETLFLPKNVKTFPGDAVTGCTNLKQILVDPENPFLQITNGLIIDAQTRYVTAVSDWTMLTVYVPDGVLRISRNAMAGHPMTRLILPDNLDYIGMAAFMGCTSLTKIQTYEATPLNDPTYFSSREMAVDAFRDCTALTEIQFPTGISSLSNSVFQGCTSLTAVTIPDHITWIGHYCFQDCTALETVVFPAEAPRKNYLANSVFRNCYSLTEVSLPKGIDVIGSDMFRNCVSLTKVTIPEGVTQISSTAFFSTAITGIQLPSTLKTIGSSAFEGCTNLTYIDLPNGLEVMDGYCFARTGLTSVVIPDSVKQQILNIGWFYQCASLEWAVLGSGITEIPTATFGRCENLIGVFIRGKLTAKVDWTCFQKCNSFGTIYYAHSESDFPGVKPLDPIFDETFKNTTIVYNYDINPRTISSDDLEETGEPVFDENAEIPTPDADSEDTVPEEDAEGTNPEEGTENVTPEEGSENTDPEEDSENTVPEEDSENTNSEEGTETTDPEEGTETTDPEENSEITAPEEASEITAPEENSNGDSANSAEGTIVASSLSFTAQPLSPGDSITYGDGGEITAVFTGLYPGQQYLLLMLAQDDSDLTPENLLYIDQAAAAADGTLDFCFTPRITGTNAQPRLIAGSLGFEISGIEDAAQYDAFYVDGAPVAALRISGQEAKLLTGYRYAANTAIEGTPEDYCRYPISMDVWKLTFQEETGTYQAELIPEMHNLLQYNGCSIRITGEKGIRMLTSIPVNTRQQLITEGIAGYTLEEYGTVLCWQSELDAAGGVLNLEASYARSNFAYKRSTGADAVFAYHSDSATGERLLQYTNVLVKFTNEQCVQPISMRPYMILKDADGNLVTVYGGIVSRSIGYIALQNANVFASGSAAYKFIHDIISYCYPSV